MFFKYKGLQFEAKPSAPDPVYAVKLQELLGGAYGEMTVAMQYLFQGWNCRMPGKYKDLILDVGTEELAHVEMISIMIARLLEGAPAETTARPAPTTPSWPRWSAG
jgi:Mn-containing catalase